MRNPYSQSSRSNYKSNNSKIYGKSSMRFNKDKNSVYNKSSNIYSNDTNKVKSYSDGDIKYNNVV